MPKRTRSYRARLLQNLVDPEEAVHYLNAAIADSKEMFLVALKDVAQAQQQMSDFAKEIGVARESLYRSFSEQGNPTFETFYSTLRALGLKLEISRETPVVARTLDPIRRLSFFNVTQEKVPALGGSEPNPNSIHGGIGPQPSRGRLLAWPADADRLGVMRLGTGQKQAAALGAAQNG